MNRSHKVRNAVVQATPQELPLFPGIMTSNAKIFLHGRQLCSMQTSSQVTGENPSMYCRVNMISDDPRMSCLHTEFRKMVTDCRVPIYTCHRKFTTRFVKLPVHVYFQSILYTNVIVIMRPDEHKKKRSAQYKKKHGMNKDDQSKDARQPKSKCAGKGKVKVDQRQEGKTDGRGASSAKLPHSSSGSDSSDNDGDSVAPVRKTFKRREVVSNWARYEILPPDTETTQKRGEDFANLLNSAGGTSSQFRFKEEEDWEDGESVCTDTKLLTVDPTDLAASLQCIPLYQRLGVDQDLFSTEQIHEMEAEAREHTLQYNPSPKPANITQPHRTNPPSTDNPSTTDHTQLLVNKVTKDKDTDGINLTVNSKENLTKPKVDGDLFKPKSDSQKSADVVACSVGASVDTTPVVRTPVINNHNSTGEKTTGVSSDNLDDDLDFLLSLENPSEATSLGETTQQNSIQETVKSPPDKTGNTTQSKESAKETENLEDWLDSVLD